MDEFRCRRRQAVRWSEVDALGVVFNAHYQMYLTNLFFDYWRDMALPYTPTMALLGGDVLLRSSSVEYLNSAHNDDLLDLALRCEQVGRSSLRFVGEVQRRGQTLARCTLAWVYVDAQSRRPAPVPEALRTALQRFESGQAMVDLRLGSWAELAADAKPIREQVFIQEQQVPVALEWDEADAGCLHALAYNSLGMPLATGRLLEHGPGVAKIGRMAVLPSLRGSGVGSQLLEALMQAARQRGDREVLLHAQCSAEGFYRRAGFTPRGAVFDEAGIPHIEMLRAL